MEGPVMRWLIVNADDLGMGPGVNRGILEAHRDGVVTSASLLVDGPWSIEAARLCRNAHGLSVGLHARIPALGAARGPSTVARCRAELSRQFSRFKDLMGHAPTHLDSHGDVHRDPALTGVFLEVADWWGVPLREHSPIRHLPRPRGYAREVPGIDVASLVQMIENDVTEGVTELICHPSHPDPHVPVLDQEDRLAEIHALCDPRVRRALWSQGIRLVTYHDLARAGLVREIAWHA
jgi:predicted glycoside hydrolase/deacetylase ChbG (UPF0249 family)